jgi:hypothetical protein
MTPKSGNQDQRSSFSLDPESDKERIKARIAQSIGDQVRGLDFNEVQEAVKEKYEDLLNHAKVKQHIPTLTEGVVRGSFRHRQMGSKKL